MKSLLLASGLALLLAGCSPRTVEVDSQVYTAKTAVAAWDSLHHNGWEYLRTANEDEVDEELERGNKVLPAFVGQELLDMYFILRRP